MDGIQEAHLLALVWVQSPKGHRRNGDRGVCIGWRGSPTGESLWELHSGFACDL